MEPLSGNSMDSVMWAVRAMRAEIFGFRFAYPLQIDGAAGPQSSLHYYIYGDSLAWDALRLDSRGIAQCCYPTTGPVYRPGFVAWYGLVHLGHYLRRREQADLQVFLQQVDWLERNAVLRNDGALVWPHQFDYKDGATFLKAPWLSANAHGLAISALVRGWRVTRRPRLLELLRKSWGVFELNVEQNGFREVVDGHVLYTEFRGRTILDHFLTALLGLYDLFIETGAPAVGQLFSDGIRGLKGMLSTWDYHQKWSWYASSHGYLCPPAYHCANRVLLEVLARLTHEPVLANFADCWSPDRLSLAGRAEIFLMFLLTKNASRLKHRTWREKRITSPLFLGFGPAANGSAP